MIFRPRELKRRHDEAVEECRIRQEELLEIEREQAADRMRDKYPGQRNTLQRSGSGTNTGMISISSGYPKGLWISCRREQPSITA